MAKITSTRFNNLQQRIAAIMGTSTTVAPTTGYGNSVRSATVVGVSDVNDITTANKIDDIQYRNLYIDLIRARVHQAGSSSVTIDPYVVGDYLTNTTNTDKIEETYTSNLESLMTTIEANKFDIDIASQATIQNLEDNVGTPIESVRLESVSGSWNGTLTHIFTVEFVNAQSRRHFFNAGGEIRFGASISWPFSQTKTTDWINLLNAMGTISFKADQTFSNAGVGSGTFVGNNNLTSTYQTCYTQTGGVYTGASYIISALESTTSKIQFRVSFQDLTSENVDENVFGDLSSTIQTAVPDGTASINGVTYDTVVYNDIITGDNISEL